MLQHLVAIHIGKDLRDGGNERRGEQSKLRPLARSLEKSIRILREEFDSLAGAVFEHESGAARRANARNGGRREGKGLCFSKPGEASIEAAHNNIGSQSFRRALVPRFQRDEIKGVIARIGDAQEAEASNCVVHLNPRRLLQDRFDFLGNLVGPL